ncbi:hypothetical protein LIER_23552 [Lithospermum erythrorhizon]|uniref:Uncharacterized protein n=1 Tax=Lithospermum erythrorhizon TaxID=34254 RepID=A0AAV3QY69_LITER
MEPLDVPSPCRWLPTYCPNTSEIAQCRYTMTVAPFGVYVQSCGTPQSRGAFWLDPLPRHPTGHGWSVWASPRHLHLH